MAQSNSGKIYELQESYVKLHAIFPILQALLIPEPADKYLRLIRAWCDEWEGVGTPGSRVVIHLQGVEWGEIEVLLKEALDKAYEVVLSPQALEREARQHIRQALQAHEQTHPPAIEGPEQEPIDQADDETARANARERQIERAEERVQWAFGKLVRAGRAAVLREEGVCGYKWRDFLYDATEPTAAMITRSILQQYTYAARTSMPAAMGQPPEISGVLRRLLDAVGRRQGFLRQRGLEELPRGFRYWHDQESMQQALHDGSRRLPLMYQWNRQRTCWMCNDVISPFFMTMGDWRNHVFVDLHPFVCLVDDCRTPNRTYADRGKWQSHIRTAHCKTVYICPVVGCKEERQSFRLQRELEEHIRATHPLAVGNDQHIAAVLLGPRRDGNDADEDADGLVTSVSEDRVWEVDALSDMIYRGTRIITSYHMYHCPLFGERLREYEHYHRHVGDHLESIAMLSHWDVL
ncbi:protein phosphatase-1 [Apiospora phragmitis]|uniref:Protein phosphatase-1 n=1 Tax=Apiospora phragmitis TaxID=2905665 RepID=A0ABR1VPM0_9PEZI